ncbi:heat shock protein [Nannochloropsis gaditana CCMP526]|uniref:heat shock protein n=1 Tax=Nannochloropsis gaditana (strain CCMP526) TaxID=1093141 RepID=UPI00029F6DA9|nr:heat shock protein [Nannochloropsis gaditana CCMP526]EKU21057.1 heat shock protein [Nannochloropsis gaditana CCMP526]|eukprot:XP_005855301.1 heat shock protein [Nannochloropsis gaditana CCMP526]
MFLVAEYFNLIMHNFVYWLEGKMWGASGPPPPLTDLGIMAFAGIFPLSYSWLVGFFLYLLIAMVLVLCLGRLLLNNVPWGCPETVLEKREGETLRTCCIPVPFVYICKRACQVLTIGLVLRVLSFVFTLEPNPADYCHPPFWDPPDALLEILGRIEIVGSCGDLLFSAHTLHAMAMMLTVLRHAPGLYLVTGLAVASMVMVVISMLAFKNHYSHDIVTDCDLLKVELPPGDMWGEGR